MFIQVISLSFTVYKLQTEFKATKLFVLQDEIYRKVAGIFVLRQKSREVQKVYVSTMETKLRTKKQENVYEENCILIDS